MQPRLQKGAWSGSLAGLPHNGQGLDLGGFGIAGRHGKRGLGAQGDGAADLRARAGRSSRAGASSAAITRGMGDEADRAGLARGAAEQRAGFERGAVGGELDQRGAAARADDLEEAEAVDRGALERLRAGSRRPLRRRPGARPCRRSSAGRSRSSRRCRGGGSRAAAAAAPASASWLERRACRRRRSGSSPGSARCAARRRGSGPCRCALRRRGRTSPPPRARRWRRGRRASRASSGGGRRGGSSLTPRERALPRLGAGEGFAGDLDVERRAFGDARGALGEEIFLAVRRAAMALRPPLTSRAARTVPAGMMPSRSDPRLDDLAVLDQHGAGLADAALDQPLRQADSPRS